MNARTEIKHGGKQEATDDDRYFITGIQPDEQTVQQNMPEENKEIKEQAVYIIIAPAEDIKYRYQFDDDVSPQVVPV